MSMVQSESFMLAMLFVTPDKKEVLVYPETISGVTWLEENKCTALLGSGGGMILVNGTRDEVASKVSKAKEQLYRAIGAAEKKPRKKK